MISKKWLVITAVCVGLIGIPLVLYDAIHGNFIRDYFIEKRVKEHLIQIGYDEKEISSVNAQYNMKLNTKKVKGTAAEVVFEDEIDEIYLFIQMRKTGKIRQECSYYSEKTGAYENDYTEERKHMDKDCY